LSHHQAPEDEVEMNVSPYHNGPFSIANFDMSKYLVSTAPCYIKGRSDVPVAQDDC